MVAIQIRNVPEEVHALLVKQAEAEGKSLNRFLLDELRQTIARRGRNAEIFARAHARPGKKPPPGDGARIIRAMRDAAANVE